MSKNNCIEIFLRARPTKNPFQGLEIKSEENKTDIFIPKSQQSGYVNNQRENFSFEFNSVFDMQTKQSTIFETIAKDVVDSALDGYNGTIFAYGQTGSGKTYTITGGAEHYEDRGIIPRTLAYIFSETEKNKENFYQISVSYLEIYNNEGFDLLVEKSSASNKNMLHDLPRVVPRENENEEIMLAGLSMHKAQNEEDALNLLFIGDTNRVVSETPKNDASTRSHCIFIIQIESKKAGSDIKTVSRLHLVDLSGSERVGKTGVEGTLFKEATHINLSLHYLEHVIVCLNKRAKGENIHVPYRNSLLTLVLRDSIGGNCKTRMIANISAEGPDIEESISTCRFACRVALIQNTAVKNEAVDPALVIERLKRENSELKAELAMLKGGEVREALTAEEREECKNKVDLFLQNKDPSYNIILNDRLKINECFYYFKHLYFDNMKKGINLKSIENDPNAKGLTNSNKENVDNQKNEEEIKKLKILIQQRDNEILILLNLINKSKQSSSEVSTSLPVYRSNISEDYMNPYQPNLKTISFPELKSEQFETESKNKSFSIKQGGLGDPRDAKFASVDNYTKDDNKSFLSSSSVNTAFKNFGGQSKNRENEIDTMLFSPLNLTNEQLYDRTNCFEMFRKSYRKNEVMEEHKQLLKSKFEDGKSLGFIVDKARTTIKNLKTRIEELRKEQAINGLSANSAELRHPDEQKLIEEIERQKLLYQENLPKLKEVKADIERITLLLEKQREKMQSDFDKWLSVMLEQRNICAPKPNLESELKSIPKVNDKVLEKKLEAFYKARDEIYKI